MSLTDAAADPVPARRPAAAHGGVLWAFHEGFAAYVSRLADGRVEVGGDASIQPDGRVLFPFTPEGLELRGSGSLHFTGHHGLLAVTITDPAVDQTGSTAVLSIDDPFVPGERMVFARLGEPVPLPPHPAMGPVRYPAPRLTEEGADLFFGHYREGTPLSPLEIYPTTDPADQDA